MTKLDYKQFTKEQISDYLDGKMDGDVLYEFESEIFTNLNLEKEVAAEVLDRIRRERKRRAIVEDGFSIKPKAESTFNPKKNKDWFKKYFGFFSNT